MIIKKSANIVLIIRVIQGIGAIWGIKKQWGLLILIWQINVMI